ncbi:MAG: pectate lyase [Muribaculaceae bacterium]|nr:pectate lyase [Muribaculaceae bacterium]
MAPDASAQREAFPGAEGYGRMTTGGRGGTVYHVTTLEDNDSPGSFRYACNRSGKRTIVFDVSGTIHLKSELKLKNGNVTIAGQTAPGGGICIANYPFVLSAPNVIIRFVRFRLGNEALKTNNKAHEGDGLGGMDSQNIIIDHCSVSWSIDECLSVYGSTDITVQWCIASHSLQNAGHSKGAHGYGGNWGGRRASYHHNLVANHSSRTPRLGPRPGTQTEEQMDFRNNVIYNYGSNGCYGGEGMNVNMVNNYYKPGKTSNSRKSRITGLGIRTLDYCFDKDNTAKNINKELGTSYTASNLTVQRINGATETGYNALLIGTKIYRMNMESNTVEIDGKTIALAWNSWYPMLHKWGTLYVDGNVNPSDAAVTADNWTTGIYSQIDPSKNDNMWNDQIKAEMKLTTPLEYVYTTTHTADDAFDKVLTYAGASLMRDEYDAIVTDDARKGNASFTSTGIIDSQDQVKYADGSTGWPNLEEGTPRVDTDNDGMPDDWEVANGLDPNLANGSVVASNGYTNLENYLNSLVAHIITAQNEGGKMLTGTLLSSDPAVELPDPYDPAGIDVVGADIERPADNRIFNLMGVEVKRPLAPGIYIQNGKKFIVR